MQFSDTSGRTGIIQMLENYLARGATAISGVTATFQEATNLVNEEYRTTWAHIFKNTGIWLFDDGNYTNLPQSSAALVSGTATYALPTEGLTVERVEVQDESGFFRVLTPLGLSEIEQGVDEFEVNDGQPRFYRLIGPTIELFPAPNYSQDDSLKVYFQRGISAFTTADTTKTPGFPSEFHNILPLGAAIRWLSMYQPTNPSLALYQQMYDKMREDMKVYFNNRFRAKKKRIKRRAQSWK